MSLRLFFERKKKRTQQHVAHGSYVLEVVSEPQDLQNEDFQQVPKQSLYLLLLLPLYQVHYEVEHLLEILEEDEFRVQVEDFDQDLDDSVLHIQRIEVHCSEQEHYKRVQINLRHELHYLPQYYQLKSHFVCVSALEVGLYFLLDELP